MVLDIFLLIIGFVLIAKGGDMFVDSSVHIGQALGIPRFIVGGTLVSLATTTPELVVSATASGVGDSGIALGNAVGSCICNIGLIIGTVAIMVPVSAGARDFANRALWMSAGGALVVIFPWTGHSVDRWGHYCWCWRWHICCGITSPFAACVPAKTRDRPRPRNVRPWFGPSVCSRWAPA